ncbi:hypothetical protein NDU88_008987 [Pleurodeles waltl]|uniref:Uncharacterized protein n=1 Tax=Pleurodeles waltl TaxID=8319 RepID=A0AAV7RWD6_PLEWA|nr:hypothetical protein NDU88_008987 [Pleurodeles waltl]
MSNGAPGVGLGTETAWRRGSSRSPALRGTHAHLVLHDFSLQPRGSATQPVPLDVSASNLLRQTGLVSSAIAAWITHRMSPPAPSNKGVHKIQYSQLRDTLDGRGRMSARLPGSPLNVEASISNKGVHTMQYPRLRDTLDGKGMMTAKLPGKEKAQEGGPFPGIQLGPHLHCDISMVDNQSDIIRHESEFYENVNIRVGKLGYVLFEANNKDLGDDLCNHV